ncbi:MAG: hypothetical protein A2103_05690 [Gammaproteobacteria bacterium GWF2_41_13]|nr:MAG: hypothetical protein A2103_05690 [Gammaproteobacteria bacterium GWF2_41_13]
MRFFWINSPRILFRRRVIIALLIVCVIGIIVFRIVGGAKSRGHIISATTVKVAPVLFRPMPIELTTLGSVEPMRSVAVVPQVTGVIKKIDFEAGQIVQANQLLFEIDPATLIADVQKAQATSQHDQAALISTQEDLDRFAALVKLGYVTRQQYDQAKAAVKEQQAQVNADNAARNQAQIQLSYTQIRSPLTGKTGNVTVKVGDVVTANSAVPLVTINQLDPVWVDFNLPERDLPSILTYQKQGSLNVSVFLEGGIRPLGTGRLVFIDNTVNAQTGTVLFKAELDNARGYLWPGLMVQVKLILSVEPNAMVVPATAVQFDQQGSFVYCLEQGKAVVQRIIINRRVGNLVVVQKGLAANESVITTISPDLSDGATVQVDTSSPNSNGRLSS